MSTSSSPIRAVIFDVGGVVITSPLIAINEYEREKGLPKDWLNVLITGHGNQGSWQRFERGELDLKSFYEGFSRDLSDYEKGKIWYKHYCQKRELEMPKLPPGDNLIIDGRDLFGRMMRGSQFDPVVVQAIKKLRATNRYRIIAVTNNFGHSTLDLDATERAFLGWEGDAASASPELKRLFDDYIDSSEVGVRKPDPAIYLLACERNEVKPAKVVMLDDLGMNLKSAKELGMKTIQVEIGRSRKAIKQLGELLQIDLLEQDTAKL